MYGDFKRQRDEIVHEKTWTWLQKGNLKRETGVLLIAALSPSCPPDHRQVTAPMKAWTMANPAIGPRCIFFFLIQTTELPNQFLK